MKRIYFCLLAIFILNCQNDNEITKLPSSLNNFFAEIDIELTDTIHKQIYTCLPIPSDSFIHVIHSDTFSQLWYNNIFYGEKLYFYLKYHIDSINEKKIIEVDSFWGPIEWEQDFTNGIYYHFTRHPEIGYSFELITKCSGKREFLKVIEPIIRNYPSKDPNDHDILYEWKSDSTKYEPTEIDAGCYYELLQNEHLEFSVKATCGC